jgi:transitional endoplasmic reticulum ATPase
VTWATVTELPPRVVNFGYCYSTVAGLAASEPVRVRADGGASIYCRLSWDLEGRVRGADRVALDSWQCAALGARDGARVEVEGLRSADLPDADFADVRLARWQEGPAERGAAEHGPGLAGFLQASGYLLYPGLRFGYQPPGGTASAEYEVAAVLVEGRPAEVAKAGTGLACLIRPGRGSGGWVPTYHQIGGLEPVIELLRREIELPLQRSRDLAAVGVQAPGGVLLYGPHGTGKTMLARAVGQHSGARVTFLSGAELASQPHAECAQALRAAFLPEEPAMVGADEPDRPPRLVIIDDLDFIAPDRSVPGADTRLLGLLHRLLDDPRRPVVLATTSRRDAIDPAIRGLARIGRQVAVPAPGEEDRKAILTVQTRWLPLSAAGPDRDQLLTGLARRTAGFVGADLEALCRQAGALALRRAFPIGVLESDQPEAKVALEICDGDWAAALTLVTPSAIDVDVTDVPHTTFADVAGQPQTVAELRERLVYPLRHPEVFAAMGLQMERGVLLYGPPGTGKTLLARAVAHECSCRFMAVRGSELLSKWFGESEQAVRDLFDRARSLAPCVVFFDEIDAIARRRSGGAHDGGASDRVVNQLLAEIDGLIDLGQVSIIGATNYPESIDPALLRPGRLGLQIAVPAPDAGGLRQLFEMYLPETLSDHYAEWAGMSLGMSGADIAMIGREARLNALRRTGFEQPTPVTPEDVAMALGTRRQALRAGWSA